MNSPQSRKLDQLQAKGHTSLYYSLANIRLTFCICKIQRSCTQQIERTVLHSYQPPPRRFGVCQAAAASISASIAETPNFSQSISQWPYCGNAHTPLLLNISTDEMNVASASIKPDKPRYLPTNVIDNDAARLYNHIHPLVIVASYLLQFRPIVANPVSSLAALLFPLNVLQVVYVVLCLQPTRSVPNPPHTRAGSSKAGRKKATTRQETSIATRTTVSYPNLG